MTTFLFKNNAISTLAGPISAIATTMTVASGAGALFPSPTGGQVFTLTLVSASNPTLFEIVYCTAVSSDTLTIVRAREGTVGLSFSAGDIVDHRLTAAALTSLVQSGSGFYLATDTGTANALAATVAGVSSLVSGQVYVIKKSALPNTGATTLYVNGLGVTALVWADGTALVDGDWPASVTGLVEYDGTQFNLLSVMGPSVFARSISAATRTFSTSASTPQALANNTATTYNNFSTSSVDFGSMAASAFTFSKAGVYAVFVGSGQSITYTGTTQTAYSTTLFKNGTAVPNASSNNGSYGGSPGGSNQTVFTVITANAGDTVASVTFVLNAYYTGGNIVSAAINITRLF